jgi:hypothetical protein
MDSTNFDTIARLAGRSLNRRDALRGIMAGAIATVAGGALLASDDASAKRRKKGKKKGTGGSGNGTGGGNQDGTGGGNGGGTLPSGALCQSDSQCNAQQHQICEVPQNASNSDHRCCGAQGAVCGGVNEDGDFIGPLCCIGEAGVRSFVCSQSDPNNPFVPGTCIPAPQD